MDTIDFKQLIDNLKEKLSHKEIKDRVGIKAIKPDELQKTFEVMQNLLDLHLEVCPEEHNQETLTLRR